MSGPMEQAASLPVDVLEAAFRGLRRVRRAPLGFDAGDAPPVPALEVRAMAALLEAMLDAQLEEANQPAPSAAVVPLRRPVRQGADGLVLIPLLGTIS